MRYSEAELNELTSKEAILAIIGGFSAMIAVAIVFEPSLKFFCWKLAGFSLIPAICVLCSRNKRLVALGIASLTIVRLIIGGGLQLLTRMSHHV